MANIPYPNQYDDELMNIFKRIIDILNSKGEALIEDSVIQQWMADNTFEPKGAIDTIAELPIDAQKRDVIGVKENNTIYVYDGTEWIVLGSLSFDELHQLETRMTTAMQELDAIRNDTNNWQKHKLTNDDGTLMTYSNFDFNTEVESVKTKDFYVTTSVNHPPNVSYDGFVQVRHRNGGNQIQVTYTPYNSNQIFMRLKNDTWGEWVEVGPLISDTGWIEFDLINGAEQNTAFMAPGDGGFKCSYRTITNGTHVKKLVRLNGRNVTSGQTIGKLPDGFVGVAQSQYIRTPLGRTSSGGLITIRPDGNIKFYVINEDGWLASDYFYGEISWDEYSKK